MKYVLVYMLCCAFPELCPVCHPGNNTEPKTFPMGKGVYGRYGYTSGFK